MYSMKIRNRVLNQLKDKRIRRRLAEALDVTDQSIMNYISVNKDNGPLTTAAALLVIHEETELSDEEILEPKRARV
jgi:glutamate dehydrogenase/leucine dehydrogenase